MAVKNDDLKDLIAVTLADLPKQDFEVGWDNQDYEFCRIYQKERMDIDGGTHIERKVMLDHTGNARYRRLYDTDTPKVGDTMKTISVKWCQIGTDYSWDKVEIMRNKNSAKGFINLMKIRRIDGLWSMANLIEERAWKTPTNASDDLYPNGVPYYFNVKTAAGAVNTSAGFVGATIDYQDGTTGTTCAGIDAADEPKWRNWASLYTDINAAFLTAFRTAFWSTRFKAPLFVNDPSNKRNAAKRIYTDIDTVVKMQELADQRDDNHSGKDLMGNLKMDETGLVMINRLPVIPIPQLSGAAYTPVYCMDFAKFLPVIHDGYWMEESEPMTDRGQHTTFTVFLDGAHNNLCLNRRTAGFVLHKSS
jgi:hypothetical protein